MTKASISSLELQITKAREAYHNTDQPIMSDTAYDKLINELRKADPRNKLLQEVGAPADSSPLAKVKLIRRMGSLDNAIGEETFKKWWHKMTARTTTFVIEPKYDGLSVQLVYKGGLLQKAITRGDGSQGEDIWHTVVNVADIPKKLNKTGGSDIKVVRGEILVKRSEMVNLPDYTNPRNAASGLLRRKDGSGAKHLSFRAFDYWMEGSKVESESKKMRYLTANGFLAANWAICHNYDEIVSAWQEMEKFRDGDSEFDMDGAVVKVELIDDQRWIQERANRGEQDDPAWAVAFKWVEKPVVTELRGVEMSVGRTGIITPVALLKPVKIGGVVVKRASLCNFEEVERLNIWIGNDVNVVRSGEVIPKVVGNHTKVISGKPIERPSHCPVCNEETEEDGPRQRCTNPACEAQVGGALLNWCAKRDILGLGPAVVEKLLAADTTEIQELYKMDEQNWIDLCESEAIGSKIYKEVQKSRTCTLSDFVGSVGIEGLGRREAAILVDHGFDTLQKMLDMRAKDLLCLPGYKITKAKKIIDGLYYFKDMLNKLSAYLNIAEPVKATSDECADKVVVFTGVRPTKDEEQQFVAKGGKITGSVSKNITHLVQKDASSSSSKSQKAKELGKLVISYEEFQTWLS